MKNIKKSYKKHEKEKENGNCYAAHTFLWTLIALQKVLLARLGARGLDAENEILDTKQNFKLFIFVLQSDI